MAVSFTQGNDFIVPTEDGQTYLGGAGNDTYMLSDATISAGSTIVIQDTEGTNNIQLVDGLSIESSLVTSNALQLTLSNGAVVQVLGADTFGYDVGGNALAGTSGTAQTFTELVEDTLGATVPAEGEEPVSGDDVTIGEGGVTPGFTVTQSASTVEEGSSVTYTITADEAVEADTAFTFALAGSGTSPATAADFSSATSGTATIAAGETSTTFTVAIAAGDDAEFAEGFNVTVADASGAEVATLNNSIIDTSQNDLTAPTVDAGQNYNYDENQAENAVIATVTASDDAEGTGIASYAITSGNDLFDINESGEITLTEAGLAAASNDFETAPNSFDLEVTATDAAGNTSDAETVTVELNNVDDVAPELVSTVIGGDTATLTFNEPLNETVNTPSADDFAVSLAGASGSVSILSVTVDGANVSLKLGRAPEAGETFKISYTPGADTIQDVAGNAVDAFSDQTLLTDSTAPSITANQTLSYIEGAYDDTTDVVGTVAATDAESGLASFSIDSGNTDGFFTIDDQGNIMLTAAGLAGAANDFETSPNSFELGVTATNGAGLTSSENITVSVTNDTADDPQIGKSMVLTSAIDVFSPESTNPASTTTSGDDVIVGDNTSALNPTAQAGDQIDGGDGNDTLKLYTTGAIIPVLDSIENLYFYAPGASVNTVSATSATALEFDVIATNRTFTIADGQVVTLDSVVAGGTTDFAGNTVTTLDLTLDGVGTSTQRNFIDLNSTAQTTLNLSGENNASFLNAATGLQNTGGTLTTINFSGDQNVAFGTAIATITTIDANTASGDLNVGAIGASNLNFTGGSGNDRIIMGATLNALDTLVGGTGDDTFGVSAAFTTATTANVSGFEIVEINAAGFAQDLSLLNSNNTLTGLVLAEAAAGNTTVTGINDATSSNIKLTADNTNTTLTVASHVSGGVSDSATLIFNDSANNGSGVDIGGTLVMANVDDVTIQSVSDGTPVTGEANSIVGFTATDMDKLTITGDQSINIATAAATLALTEVDASGLTVENGGTFTFSSLLGVGIASLLVKGTTGNDNINIAANGTAGTIYTNGGTDILTIDSGQASTLQFTSNSLGSGDLAAGTAITINTATAAGDLVFNMTSGVENALNFGSVNLGSSAANVLVNAGINATNNIGYSEVGLDSFIQIDLNGDGAYNATDDVQIQIIGAAGTLAGVQYSAAADTFTTV